MTQPPAKNPSKDKQLPQLGESRLFLMIIGGIILCLIALWNLREKEKAEANSLSKRTWKYWWSIVKNIALSFSSILDRTEKINWIQDRTNFLFWIFSLMCTVNKERLFTCVIDVCFFVPLFDWQTDLVFCETRIQGRIFLQVRFSLDWLFSA